MEQLSVEFDLDYQISFIQTTTEEIISALDLLIPADQAPDTDIRLLINQLAEKAFIGIQ
jgi:hypothetical protein